MTRLLLFISLFFPSVIAYTTPPASPLSIKLSHLTDTFCTNHYSNTEPAIPGSCIQYHIHLTNNSTDTLRDLFITGRIPQHTKLHQAPSLIGDNQTDENMSYTIEKDVEHEGDSLHITLKELPPSTEQTTIIQYQVKIDE